MSDFDRIEEHRDLVAGLEYEAWWDERQEVDPKLAFKRSVIDRDGACVVYHGCEGELQAHHVVTQQHLRKRGFGDWAWDRRIGVTVCERAHRRHHSARERIPFDSLPLEVVRFVEKLGLAWYFERYYADAPAPEMEQDLATGRARLRDRTAQRGKGFAR